MFCALNAPNTGTVDKELTIFFAGLQRAHVEKQLEFSANEIVQCERRKPFLLRLRFLDMCVHRHFSTLHPHIHFFTNAGFKDAMSEFKIAESALPTLQKRLQRLAHAAKKEPGQGLPRAAAPLFGLQIVQGWWMLVDGDGTVRVRIFCKKIVHEIWGAPPSMADGVDLAKVRATESFVLLMARYLSLQTDYEAEIFDNKPPWRKPTNGQEIDDMLREIAVHMVVEKVRAVQAIAACDPTVLGPFWLPHAFLPPKSPTEQFRKMYIAQVTAHHTLLVMVPKALGMLQDRLKAMFAETCQPELDVSGVSGRTRAPLGGDALGDAGFTFNPD